MSFLASLFFVFHSAWALEYTNHIYNNLGQKTDLSHIISQVHEGDVVIVGEKHGFFPHHEMQASVIESLQKLGFRVDVGMEHISYLKQNDLNDYFQVKITEDQLLLALNWRQSKHKTCREYTEDKGYEDPFAALPFDCYKKSLQLAHNYGGSNRAINLPRSLTGKVSSQGIDSLTSEEQELLPPNYQWGSPSYFERFRETMLSFGDSHGAITEEMIKNMFWSQSLWDETMSWKSTEYMAQNPGGVMVIIVGDFHAAFGDGLAARFRARGVQRVHVISQNFVEEGTQDEIDSWAQPDAKYGPAGDLVVITKVK
ncbi:MAG: ChaN family lipoprotein [Bdellovibrionaceae bacterium]|nr:ChaN family lipoprotein [Pseudobdellovibrionaceae bacterium]